MPVDSRETPVLLPCPFCGKPPRFVDDDGYGDCQVFCAEEFNGCPAPQSFGPKADQAKVIAAWNRRANGGDDLLEACKEAFAEFIDNGMHGLPTPELLRKAIAKAEAR